MESKYKNQKTQNNNNNKKKEMQLEKLSKSEAMSHGQAENPCW